MVMASDARKILLSLFSFVPVCAVASSGILHNLSYNGQIELGKKSTQANMNFINWSETING